MILKSTQENELLLKQEKWQDFLAQKPRNTQAAPVRLSPARAAQALISGSTVRQRCPRHCRDHTQGDSQLCPIPGESWVLPSTKWLKENNLETHP